jgi:microcystin-dependent protein
MADLLVLSDAGGNLSSIEFPAGMIMMYSGSSAPRGWAVCDGSGATPDLRGRFIMGNAPTIPVGASGGAKDGDIKLTTAQLPSHSHNMGWMHYRGYSGGGGYNYTWGTDKKHFDDIDNTPLAPPTQSTGDGQAISIYPPYYGLMYVMKL